MFCYLQKGFISSSKKKKMYVAYAALAVSFVLNPFGDRM